VLVPVCPCHGLVGDVWLLGIVRSVAVWLRRLGHGRRLLDVVGVDGLHAGDGLVGRHGGEGGGKLRGWAGEKDWPLRQELRSASDVY
jgi:hypothetical protein